MNEYSSEMRGLPMLDEFSFKVLELKNGFLIQKVRHILKYISLQFYQPSTSYF